MNQQREYQRDGVVFLSKPRDHGVLLCDDPGLGKTNQALMALKYLRPDPESVLIIAPLIAHGTWIREAREWIGEDVAVLRPSTREVPATRIVVTNPEEVQHVAKLPIDWDLIIVDEIHLYRNRKTNRYKSLEPLTRKSLVWGLTGSPIVNGAFDLWSQLHLIAPREFRSYWTFVDSYLTTYVNSQGHPEVLGEVQDADRFKQMLKRYVLRRRKDAVLSDLPVKTRQPLYVTMSRDQQRAYKEIADDMVTQLTNGNYLLTPSILAQMTRLRQTLITPALYGGKHSSAAIDAVVESIGLDFDARLSAAVFTPFVSAIPFIKHALTEKLKSVDISVLQGATKADEREPIITRFQQLESHRKVLICGIDVATSFTATGASQGYFLGYDWTPTDNIQAEDRLHRYGQQNPVNIKYVVHPNTVDEHVLNILDQKVTWSELATNPLRFMEGRS